MRRTFKDTLYSRPKIPKKSVDESRLSKRIREWLPLIVGIGGLALVTLTYLENRKKQDLEYKRALQEASEPLGTPVMNTGKEVDPAKLGRAYIQLQEQMRRRENEPDAHILAGALAIGMGDQKGALRQSSKAAELAPNNARALIIQGVMEAGSGRLEKAASALEKASEISAAEGLSLEVAVAEADWASVLAMQGDFSAAEDRLEVPLKNPNTRSVAHNTEGIIAVQTGDLARAQVAFSSAAKEDPEYGLAYFNLGCVLQEQGKIEEAQASFDRARQLNVAVSACKLTKIRPDFLVKHGPY